MEAVVDTGVLVEYINESSPHHPKVRKLLEGNNSLYITPVTMSEVMYVGYRVYKAAGLSNANELARELFLWASLKLKVTDVNKDVALQAGEIKKKYGIALPDCYVIATANHLGVKALFKREKELIAVIDKIEKEFKEPIIFVDEI